MALYPEAKIDLITKGTPVALTRVDGYLAHTIVGSAESCINMFKGNGYGGSTSHFVMAHDGTVTQLVDTKHRANCQVEGNWRLLSCEHADYGEGFPKWNLNDAGQVPAFTDAQVDAEIELQVWMSRTHGFPARLMGSSKGEQGIGYHKLGCDPYRVSGGEKWSSSYGKVCPGTRRIEQLQTIIIPEVQRRLAGAEPIPTIPEDDDMPYLSWPKADQDALTKAVASTLRQSPIKVHGGSKDEDMSVALARMSRIEGTLGRILAAVETPDNEQETPA